MSSSDRGCGRKKPRSYVSHLATHCMGFLQPVGWLERSDTQETARLKRSCNCKRCAHKPRGRTSALLGLGGVGSAALLLPGSPSSTGGRGSARPSDRSSRPGLRPRPLPLDRCRSPSRSLSLSRSPSSRRPGSSRRLASSRSRRGSSRSRRLSRSRRPSRSGLRGEKEQLLCCLHQSIGALLIGSEMSVAGTNDTRAWHINQYRRIRCLVYRHAAKEQVERHCLWGGAPATVPIVASAIIAPLATQ